MSHTLGLYLHIPYCLAKCYYCDFYSMGGSRCVPDEYLNALLREMHRLEGRRPDTLYFGGGTPSLLTPAQVEKLIHAANPKSGAEITLEANPETVTFERLTGFYAAGVNRISFGVQSAHNAQLQALGRPHTAQQAQQALFWAKKAGFRNISGDIMMALPRYSCREFDDTLSLLQQGGCTHISAYLLKIEPHTVFGKCPPAGLPTPDEAADFYLYAVSQLEKHGYRQYEISNFAKPGYEGQHNLLYWNCEDYLGLGPGAHSCMHKKRFYWPNNTHDFVAGCSPVQDGGCDAEDYLIMRLRLCSGLSLTKWKQLWGGSLTGAQMDFINHCVKAGYAVFDGETLALTPAGLIVQNSILEELI